MIFQMMAAANQRPRSKKSWTASEDKELLRLVELHSGMNWALIAEGLSKDRTAKQCRERYHNHLQPDVRKGEWTSEEDELIVKLQGELGNQWAKIAKMLPGRTDNAVKNRWHTAVRSFSRSTAFTFCNEAPRPAIMVPPLELSLTSLNDRKRSRQSPTHSSPDRSDVESRYSSNSDFSVSSQSASDSSVNQELWELDVTDYAHDHAHSHSPGSGATVSFSPMTKKTAPLNRNKLFDHSLSLDTARSTQSMLSTLSIDWLDDILDGNCTAVAHEPEFSMFVFTPREFDSPFVMSPQKRSARGGFSPDGRNGKRLCRGSSADAMYSLDTPLIVITPRVHSCDW